MCQVERPWSEKMVGSAMIITSWELVCFDVI